MPKTHGMRGARVYRIWNAMIQRCTNPNQSHYPRYGGRGVTVCVAWWTFAGFYADMGDPPSETHSIERDDNDRGYEPGNCRWATPKEQRANQRKKRPYTRPNSAGEKHFKAKITEEMVREIRASSERNCDLADRIGLSRATIADIRTRRTWRHVE